MTLIDRYIARQIAWTSLWALLALAGVIWISQALHDIDLMTTQGQSLIKFFAVTILTLPAMASIIAPVAFLIGLIVTLNRLNQESELAVLASAGLSPTRLLKPLLIMGLVAALLTGLLTLIVVPQSIQTWRTTITQIRSDFLTKIVKAGRFNELEAKVVFHYRERAGDALLGIFIQDSRDPDLTLVYVAERGRIVSNANGTNSNYLVLENGSVQRETGRSRDASIVAFQRYALDLSQLAPSNGDIIYSAHERLTVDLMSTYLGGRETSADLVKIASELADRFATPLYAFPFALVCLLFLGRARTTRSSTAYKIIMTILVCALVRIAGFILVVNGKGLPYYLNIAVLFPVVAALTIFIIDLILGRRIGPSWALLMGSKRAFAIPRSPRA